MYKYHMCIYIHMNKNQYAVLCSYIISNKIIFIYYILHSYCIILYAMIWSFISTSNLSWSGKLSNFVSNIQKEIHRISWIYLCVDLQTTKRTWGVWLMSLYPFSPTRPCFRLCTIDGMIRCFLISYHLLQNFRSLRWILTSIIPSPPKKIPQTHISKA